MGKAPAIGFASHGPQWLERFSLYSCVYYLLLYLYLLYELYDPQKWKLNFITEMVILDFRVYKI